MGNRLKRIKNNSGFTLIEILLVISIAGLIMVVSLPISYNMYMSYKASLKAEEVLVFISKVKREAFLYSEENLLYTKDGVIHSDDGQGKVSPVSFPGIFVQSDTPVKFFKNGTTSGGMLKIYTAGYTYHLLIKSPFGDLMMEKGA